MKSFQLLRKRSDGNYKHNKYVADDAHVIRFASKIEQKTVSIASLANNKDKRKIYL